jgi:hypothetical protein
MKLATSPRPFTFVIISLSLLIVQFGFINHFLAFPEQGQPPTPEPTQSIPETYLPVVIDTAANQNSSGAGIASSPQLADDEFLPYTETVADTIAETVATAVPLLEENASTDTNNGSLVEEASSSIFETSPVEIPPLEATNGDGALIEQGTDSDFESFRQEVTNGDSDTVTGIYVAGLFRLRVLQQPPQDVGYVSSEDGTATQFQSPALYGVIGLLAHNFLSGKQFFNLALGHEIRIVFGSGSFSKFRVSGIADFERMTRFDIRSDFRDLQTDELLSSKDLFARFYREGNYLTLQTCLEGDGISNWGVRMISAVPIDS